MTAGPIPPVRRGPSGHFTHRKVRNPITACSLCLTFGDGMSLKSLRHNLLGVLLSLVLGYLGQAPYFAVVYADLLTSTDTCTTYNVGFVAPSGF